MEQPVSGRAIMMAQKQKQRSESDGDPQWWPEFFESLVAQGRAEFLINMMPKSADTLSPIDAEFTVVDVKRVDHE